MIDCGRIRVRQDEQRQNKAKGNEMGSRKARRMCRLKRYGLKYSVGMIAYARDTLLHMQTKGIEPGVALVDARKRRSLSTWRDRFRRGGIIAQMGSLNIKPARCCRSIRSRKALDVPRIGRCLQTALRVSAIAATPAPPYREPNNGFQMPGVQLKFSTYQKDPSASWPDRKL